jgi:hypothetical protein
VDRYAAQGDLRVFVGLASEWEDHPNDRPEIETAVIEQSQLLLARERPRTWLKVQARRGGSALWRPRTQESVDLTQLPISLPLKARLSDWQRLYDATFKSGSMEQDGFASESDARSFVESGWELVAALQDELGPSWHVEYMQEPTKPPGLRLAHR